MKTPEEIKNGLEACGSDECYSHHTDCPYRGDLFCIKHICGDARAYINQLEARIDTLTAKAVLFDEAVAAGEKYKRERDAAVEQLRKGGRACSTCKFSEDIPENDKICEECRLTGTKLLYSNWEWVGPQEVE